MQMRSLLEQASRLLHTDTLFAYVLYIEYRLN